MTSNTKAVRAGFFSALAVTLAFPAAVFAQNAPSPSPNCPPGSWFCAGGNASAGASAGASGGASANGQLQPLPAASAPPAPAAPPAPTAPPAPPAPPAVDVGPTPAAPPVVVYQPAPPVVVVQGRADAPPPYYYRPRPATRLPYNRMEWGLNLRLEGAILGRDRAGNSDMGGGGVALRFKPSPFFGVEGGVDFLGGHDYNGNRRGETNVNLSGLIYVNPRSHVQVYFPIGIDWSTAWVTYDQFSPYLSDGTLHYFGGHAGVGLEFRCARHFALNAALIGFIRGRTDSDADAHPEFVDSSGRKTNTSGGGVFQAGMTIYF